MKPISLSYNLTSLSPFPSLFCWLFPFPWFHFSTLLSLNVSVWWSLGFSFCFYPSLHIKKGQATFPSTQGLLLFRGIRVWYLPQQHQHQRRHRQKSERSKPGGQNRRTWATFGVSKPSHPATHSTLSSPERNITTLEDQST